MQATGFDASFLTLAGLVVASFLVIKFVMYVMFFIRYHNIMDKFPGEQDFSWLYGNLHKFGWPHEEGLEHQRALTARFPFAHRIWFGPDGAVLFVHHPETVKIILKSSEPKPRSINGGGSTGYEFGLPWLGEGLIIANGDKWARNRRLLTPAFHFNILQPYVIVNNKCANILLEKIETCSRAGQSFELFDFLSMCTLDIVLRCAFSYLTNCQIIGEGHPYVHAVTELTKLWQERLLNPFFRHDFIYNLSASGRKFKKQCDFVHSVAEKIIAARKESLDRSDSDTGDAPPSRKYLDFLDILLKAKDEQGEGLTPLEIRNEVDTFLFAGHDTTTSSISWILYSLVQHPEIQDRVRAEVDDVMRDKPEDVIEWHDLHKLEYLTMCIKEGLRLHCPVPMVGRKLTKDIIIDGKRAPRGNEVNVQIYETHHNPEVWENPEEFQPDRFLPENVDKRDPFAFIAFSAGSRNCIGQNFAMHEMKTLIARILYKYNLELDPTNIVKKRLSIVMKAETGIKMFA